MPQLAVDRSRPRVLLSLLLSVPSDDLSHVGKITLLNVLERQLSAPANYRSGICALFITKLLQDMVEVAAEGGHVGLVRANGGGL